MKKLINWVKNNPNRSMFLVPIILVAGISISHVVSWYDIANPISWAIYLSIAIEVGAMTALVAATNKIKGGVWFMFGLITFIQMIGNIFYSYKEIDQNGDLFKSWVELTAPVWEMIGSDTSDIPSMKRWLAFLEGGLLPIISLTSLHFFVKYDGKKEEDIDWKEKLVKEPINPPPPPTGKVFYVDLEGTTTEDQEIKSFQSKEDNDEIDDENIERLTNLQKEVSKVWEKVKELKEEGKLPPDPTTEELKEEPTALAFTPYEIEEVIEEVTEEETIPQDDETTNDNITTTEDSPTNDSNLSTHQKTIIYKGRDRNGGFTRIDRIS